MPYAVLSDRSITYVATHADSTALASAQGLILDASLNDDDVASVTIADIMALNSGRGASKTVRDGLVDAILARIPGRRAP